MPSTTWLHLSLIHAVGGMTVTATYYGDVRVPAGNVVGEVDGGWRLMTAQLNHERVGLAALGGRMTQLWSTPWPGPTETGVIELPWVRRSWPAATPSSRRCG